MPRGKVKLAWIENASSRRLTLKKMEQALLKMVTELTILCGVPALLIIFSPDTNKQTVWPDQPAAVQLLLKFLRLPDYERSMKMLDHESYLLERTVKLEQKIEKARRESMNLLLDQIYRGNKSFYEFHRDDITDLANYVGEKMNSITSLIDFQEGVRANNDSRPPAMGTFSGFNGGNNLGNEGNNVTAGNEAAMGFGMHLGGGLNNFI